MLRLHVGRVQMALTIVLDMQQKQACRLKCRTYIEIAWKFGSQLLCILSNLIVQIDVGSVLQQVVLPVHSCHHFGMAVTNAHSNNASKSLQTSRFTTKQDAFC